jgi:hypothetical protein
MSWNDRNENISFKKYPTWDISNKGKVYIYTSKEIDILRKMKDTSYTLQNFAEMFKRDLSGILIKLDRLDVIDVHDSKQKLADNIDKIKDLTYYELRKRIDYIINFKPYNKEKFENYAKINTSVLRENVISVNKPTTTILKEQKMSYRKTIIVELFDDSPGLDVEFSKVFSVETVTESQEANLIIQEVMLDTEKNVVAEAIAKHNKLRLTKTDESILKNTGNEIFLREVKIKDLRWNIR